MKVALDIGGANIKYCLQQNNNNLKSGSIPINSHHVFSFESELELILQNIIKGATSVFFTSTCELLYHTKIEAESRIIELLRKINKMNNQSCNFFYFSKNGELVVLEDYVEGDFTGGYNWNITKQYFKKRLLLDESWIILDCGSTSTDLIPIVDTKIMNHMERNVEKQFLYLGLKRSLIQSITNEITINNFTYRFASEPVCRTSDVFFLLEEISEMEYRETNYVDIHISAKEQAERNVASLVCADVTEISTPDIIKICKEIKKEFDSIIVSFLGEIIYNYNIVKPKLVLVGSSAEYVEKVINENKSLGVEVGHVSKEYTPAIGLVNLYQCY